MRVLVTGGGGFIGGHVCDELASLGHVPMVFDVTYPGIQPGSYGYYLGDVRDSTAVTEAAAHADGIIHLAAVLGSQETIANPKPAIETNLTGTINVFEAAVQYDLPVAYAAVGNAWMRPLGAGAYTITKEACVDFAQMYRQYRGAKINVVRPMNAYGPRQSVTKPYGHSAVRKIVPTFICQALSGRPIEVYGDGTQISDIVYVSNVAGVFVRALEEAAEGNLHDTAEVGPISHMNVLEVAVVVQNEVRRQSGSTSHIVHLPMRPGEIEHGTTIANSLSTLPPYGVNALHFIGNGTGLATTVKWYIENEGKAWQIPSS